MLTGQHGMDGGFGMSMWMFSHAVGGLRRQDRTHEKRIVQQVYQKTFVTAESTFKHTCIFSNPIRRREVMHEI
jgi:hypothetical protein